MGTDPLAWRWCESKRLSPETLDRAGVVLAANRLWFGYSRPVSNVTDYRYFDLAAWDRGQPYKFWVSGSQAKGATWWTNWDLFQPTSLLLCEGETDALAAVQARAPFDLIAAVPGAHMTTAQSLRQLERYDITLAFDQDDAGNAGAQQVAWLNGGLPLKRLVYRPGTKDLRDALKDQSFDFPQVSVVQEPVRTPARPVQPAIQDFRKAVDKEDKPDLNRVWDVLSPRSKRVRQDGQGRAIRQAWCPLHDDGKEPAAWVGAERWGCFACGIESADVYELVAWVRGYATVGVPLTGESFKSAREEARRLA